MPSPRCTACGSTRLERRQIARCGECGGGTARRPSEKPWRACPKCGGDRFTITVRVACAACGRRAEPTRRRRRTTSPKQRRGEPWQWLEHLGRFVVVLVLFYLVVALPSFLALPFEFSETARVVGGLVLIALSFVLSGALATRVGYRWRDVAMLLIPVWNFVIWIVWLWRVAARRRYWTEPEHPRDTR